jgi:hypothetical protein
VGNPDQILFLGYLESGIAVRSPEVFWPVLEILDGSEQNVPFGLTSGFVGLFRRRDERGCRDDS